MYSPPRTPPPLKRSVSGSSRTSYGSASTSASRSSSRLLFGEIPLTPATSVGTRSSRSNSSIGSICNLVLSTSSSFLRFWLNDTCRDNLFAHMDEEDLPNFRLVCHDFATRAAPVQFASLTTTFKPSTFSKPARMDALSRIGHHVKTFTFHLPHGPETLLPPIIDPETGEEKQFIYEPQLQTPQTMLGREKTPKYGSLEMTNLLIHQYPPLFHAATNVPAFIAAFSEFISLTHLKISCPGYDDVPFHRRSVVDYALISLRIAIERAPLYALTSLSLHPIHPGGLLYLHPMHGFGSTPSSAKRWTQIRTLSICMESVTSPTSSKHRTQSVEHLRILHAYLRTLSHTLTRLFFRWKGPRGPSPLSLDKEPCMLPLDIDMDMNAAYTHPTQRRPAPTPIQPPRRAPRPLRFPRLRHMELENAIMDSTQIASFIHAHRRSLTEFNFEDVKLRQGSWDEALAPLTRISGSERWKRNAEEVMDVPIVLSPTRGEPRIMGPLLEEVDAAIGGLDGSGHGSAGAKGRSLSRWLGGRKSVAPMQMPQGPGHGYGHDHSHGHGHGHGHGHSHGKESFFGGEHVKKLFRSAMFQRTVEVPA